MARKQITYQAAMEELETILADIENNQVEIDDLSKKVKRASELAEFCSKKLKDTEQDIEQMVKVLSE